MQMYLSWSGHYQQLQQELEQQRQEQALQQERENLIRSEVQYQLAINHPDFHRKQQEHQRSMQRYEQEHREHQSKSQHEEALEAQREKIEQLHTQLLQRQCLLQDLRDTVQALLPQRLQPSLPSVTASKQSPPPSPPSPPVPAPQREAPQSLSPRVLPVRSTPSSPPLLSVVQRAARGQSIEMEEGAAKREQAEKQERLRLLWEEQNKLRLLGGNELVSLTLRKQLFSTLRRFGFTPAAKGKGGEREEVEGVGGTSAETGKTKEDLV